MPELRSLPVDLDVVFLGTSGERAHRAARAERAPVRRGGDRLLFDCGEGTQRQLLRSSVGLVDLHEIFLTHFHADHYLGLPGMLKTFALRGREVPLTIYGPPGLRDLFGVARPRLRQAHLPGRARRAPGRRCARARRLQGARLPGRATGRPPSATRSSRRRGPVASTSRHADALGVPSGPERGALQRGETVTLADGRTIAPEAGARAAARRGARSSTPATRRRPTSSAMLFHGADVLVHEATFGDEERDRAAETTALDGRPGGRDRARRRRCGCSR